MTPDPLDPVMMTPEQVQRYREAVAALIAASLQRLHDYPPLADAEPQSPGAAHE